jgi:uncharacterized protein
MEILHTGNGKKGKFYMEQDGEQVAELVYTWAGTERFIIEHTEVSEVLEGKGAGKQLVAKAVAFAREKQVRILPLCPFAKGIFDRIADYRDVL